MQASALSSDFGFQSGLPALDFWLSARALAVEASDFGRFIPADRTFCALRLWVSKRVFRKDFVASSLAGGRRSVARGLAFRELADAAELAAHRPGGPSRHGRAWLPAHRDASPTTSRSATTSSRASACRCCSRFNVGISSSCEPERKAVGSSSMRMVQYAYRGGMLRQ